MTKQKLKIGLLLNGHSVMSWEYKMVKDIIDSGQCDVCLVLLKNNTASKAQSFLGTTWSNRKYILYKAYQKFEDKFFRPTPNAFAKKDLKDLVSCEELSLESVSVFELIENRNIDVLINFDCHSLPDNAKNIAKYGLWTLRHGNRNISKDVHAGIWEVLKGEEQTASSLRITTKEEHKTIVAYESFSHTDHISFNRNRNNFFWKTSSFIPRKLEELYRLGGEKFFEIQDRHTSQSSLNDKQTYNAPTNLEMLRGLAKNYYDSVKIHIRNYFYRDQWTLLYRFNSPNSLSQSFDAFKRITPPKDRFWADPFILERNDKYYIFLEELEYSDKRGNLAVMELDSKGNYTTPKTILEKEYHLSYPFLIEDKGVLYMVPEAKGDKSISIYKCTDFPYQWEFVKYIFKDIQAVDSTIYKHNGKFWLFTNIKENDGASAYDELFLFHSEDLLGDTWVSHPMNPIVSDVKCARPAGNIFEYEGRLIRPSQNCAKHYGYGMQVREIITINELEYEEKQIRSIYPDWDEDLVSTHTFNQSGDLTIIDALVRRKK